MTANPSGEGDGAGEEPEQPPLRLLFIDDDAAFASLAARALRRKGFDIRVASDGASGLAMLDDADFDAITLDHMMPGMSGSETLAGICARDAPPPVIYVTGADEGRIAVNALKAGAADYIVKDTGPDFFELLARTITQAIEAQRLRRAARAQETEIRAARDRAELLLKEVNHRVANSLALVSSLAHMQALALDAGEGREALLAFQRRVLAVAQVHRRLYTSDDVREVALDVYLDALIEDLRESFVGEHRVSDIRLVAEPVRMPTDRAISLGVIVSELVSNACKYAYPDAAPGEVRVHLRAAPARLVLAVEDDGVGLAADSPTGTALGSRIVDTMARALGARVTRETPARGACISLEIPLAHGDPAAG
ncbi:MAG: sensor histidine kinase [Thermaurantiacus sp.]